MLKPIICPDPQLQRAVTTQPYTDCDLLIPFHNDDDGDGDGDGDDDEDDDDDDDDDDDKEEEEEEDNETCDNDDVKVMLHNLHILHWNVIFGILGPTIFSEIQHLLGFSGTECHYIPY